MVYMGVSWRELEPEKGVYAFDAIESSCQLNRWTSEGKKAVLRIVLDFPGSAEHRDIPDWLFDETEGAGTAYDGVLGKGFSPDYENPVLIAAHQRLLAAMGDRYNGDSRIAMIELGSLGHWGEWHTLQDDKVSIAFPRLETAEIYVKHYLDAFPDMFLLMRRPHAIAKSNDMGLFNDMFGDWDATTTEYLSWIQNGYQSWLTGEFMPGMPDFWKTAPSGGELANGKDGLIFLNTENISDTLEQAKQTHLSWLGPNIPISTDVTYQNNIDRLRNTMGYRFVIRSESHSAVSWYKQVLAGTLVISNLGVAPFYFSWPVEMSLQDELGNRFAATRLSTDIRTWMPGNSTVDYEMNLPSGLKKGEYRLVFAILDPDTGKPGIFLPMVEKTGNGWYMLGTVSIR